MPLSTGIHFAKNIYINCRIIKYFQCAHSALHIKNHNQNSSSNCQKLLHPDRIYESHPHLKGTRNTQAGEEPYFIFYTAKYNKLNKVTGCMAIYLTPYGLIWVCTAINFTWFIPTCMTIPTCIPL